MKMSTKRQPTKANWKKTRSTLYRRSRLRTNRRIKQHKKNNKTSNFCRENDSPYQFRWEQHRAASTNRFEASTQSTTDSESDKLFKGNYMRLNGKEIFCIFIFRFSEWIKAEQWFWNWKLRHSFIYILCVQWRALHDFFSSRRESYWQRRIVL